MKKPAVWIALLLVALALAWYIWMRSDQADLEQAQVLPPVLPETPSEPVITHPVERITVPTSEPAEPEPEPEPLPSLLDSDNELIDQAIALVGTEAVDLYLVADMIISRLVATIDSLTSAQIAPLMLPVEPTPGKFEAMQAGEGAAISPLNAARYNGIVSVLTAVDSGRLVALYVRYYPLFQEAYRQLGYPTGYFNDRLVEVIDHLLATPEVSEPIPLVKVEAVYAYADPELEALSAGQKTLLRMGQENASAVNAKLAEIRALVTGEAGPGTLP